MGFPTDRFDRVVHEMFHCTFCKNVLENPKMINIPECEHLYCEPCLTQLDNNTCPEDGKEFRKEDIRAPIKFFLSLYSELKVSCTFREANCEAIVPILELENHKKECPENPENYFICDKICGLRIRDPDPENHHCGQHFRRLIYDLTNQLERSQDKVEQLKDQYLTEINKLQQQVIKLKQRNQELLRAPGSSSTVPKPGSSSAVPRPGSSSTVPKTVVSSSSDTSVKSVKPTGNLVDIFKTTVSKYCRQDPASFNEDRTRTNWWHTSLSHILNNIVIDPIVAKVVSNYNISEYLHHNAYKHIIALKRNDETEHFLLSFAALQYLIPRLDRTSNIMIIREKGHCLLPYFAFRSQKVVRFANEHHTNYYQSKSKELHNEKNKIKHCSYVVESDLIATAKDLQYPFTFFSTIISFEDLSLEACTQLLNLCTSSAILFILNLETGFKKAILDAKGDLAMTVIAEAQQVHCDFFV